MLRQYRGDSILTPKVLLGVLGLVVACRGSAKNKQPGAPEPSAPRAAAGLSSAAPGLPPPTAKALACGGNWLLVRAGTQPGPQVPNLMRAHVRVWDRNGTQVFSSLKAKDGIVNDLDTLPPALQEMIRITGMGGIARAWLPPEAMAAWKPGSFPNEELVFELELLGEVPPRAQTVKEVPVGQGSSAAGSGFAPPDLAGAPRDARTTSTGLKFVVQAPGNGPRPTSGSRAGVLVDAWASRGLKLEQVVTGHAVTVSIDSAPAGLGDVLTELATKGRARVWVPPSRATQLFPAHKDVPLIVDVTLTAIESS